MGWQADRSLPKHTVANRRAILETCPSGEEPPEAKARPEASPSGEDKSNNWHEEVERHSAANATSLPARWREGSRPPELPPDGLRTVSTAPPTCASRRAYPAARTSPPGGPATPHAP